MTTAGQIRSSERQQTKVEDRFDVGDDLHPLVWDLLVLPRTSRDLTPLSVLVFYGPANGGRVWNPAILLEIELRPQLKFCVFADGAWAHTLVHLRWNPSSHDQKNTFILIRFFTF